MKNLAFIMFCCLTLSSVAQIDITSAEYFIGDDPGFGNATSLDVTPGQTISESFQIPVNGLSDGYHFLHIRVKDANGTWSHFAKKMFATITPIPQAQLNAAEYFVGDDPGFGLGHPLAVQTGDTISSTFEIPVAELAENEFHFLHIRTRDTNGKWSHFIKKMFYVMAPDEDNTILAVEYFIDQDPGIGQGTALPVDPATTINEEFAISLPDTLMDGFHFLHIRVQNSDLLWSHYAREQFLVGDEDGIDEWAAHLSIYPNPSSGPLYLHCENTRIERATLINIHGQVMMDAKPEDGRLNLVHLADGVYLLQVYTDRGAVSRKIVKQ